MKEPELEEEAELGEERCGRLHARASLRVPPHFAAFPQRTSQASRASTHPPLGCPRPWFELNAELRFAMFLLWAERIHGQRRIWGLSLSNRRSRHFRRNLHTRTSASQVKSPPLGGLSPVQDLESPDSASYRQAREPIS